MPDVTLGATEEPTECSESTSAMIAPSAGTATVNDGELCDVCCIVLAPRIGTDGAIDNFFVASQDTAPGGGGTFLRSWQCTMTIGESESFCIPRAQPMSDTIR